MYTIQDTSIGAGFTGVNLREYPCERMRRRSLGRGAADTPLARWLVDYGDARGWTSGRQAAAYLGVNQSALATWLRGEGEPSAESQIQLAEATGVPFAEIAELVRRTKSQLQRLTVGDLRRLRAQEETPAGTTVGELGTIGERLERIERRLEGIDRIERKVTEGLSEMEIRAIVDEIFRRREQGTLPETYIDDPDPPEDVPQDDYREAVG